MHAGRAASRPGSADRPELSLPSVRPPRTLTVFPDPAGGGIGSVVGTRPQGELGAGRRPDRPPVRDVTGDLHVDVVDSARAPAPPHAHPQPEEPAEGPAPAADPRPRAARRA